MLQAVPQRMHARLVVDDDLPPRTLDKMCHAVITRLVL